MRKMEKFQDKVAIVTGGGSGIGRALCEALGRFGAVVIVADINDDASQQVASSILRAIAAPLDVTKSDDVEKLVRETALDHGRLDFLFNNAGIMTFGEVRDLEHEHWQRMIDVNLMGVVFGTNAAYKLMVDQGFGHIVNIASIAGLIGSPTSIPYSMTKFGVVGLSTSLRTEGEDLNVKVSVVCPGFVETPIMDNFNIINADKDIFVSSVPKKFISPEKAARIILKGVTKNRRFIVFPLPFRIMWWLYRIHPSLILPIQRVMLRGFRSARI